jgi:GTP-binding protein EngB required for normal cell division
VIDPQSNNRLAINVDNWKRFVEVANANQCLPKIALLGTTAVGKSRLIRELMPFSERVMNLRYEQ